MRVDRDAPVKSVSVRDDDGCGASCVNAGRTRLDKAGESGLDAMTAADVRKVPNVSAICNEVS